MAIVDQIAEHNPHLIALQEISLIRIQIPGDFMIGNPVAADAAAAVWRLYADGLIWWMWIVAMCGTVMATIASNFLIILTRLPVRASC